MEMKESTLKAWKKLKGTLSDRVPFLLLLRRDAVNPLW